MVQSLVSHNKTKQHRVAWIHNLLVTIWCSFQALVHVYVEQMLFLQPDVLTTTTSVIGRIRSRHSLDAFNSEAKHRKLGLYCLMSLEMNGVEAALFYYHMHCFDRHW